MSKRRRSDSPAADERIVPSGSVIRSEHVWYDDGNIVLQAENTRFRVHQGVLTKHSPVFADLFRTPQPTNKPVVDGFPVVQLPDSAKDITHLLCMLYGDTDTVARDGVLYFRVVGSIVRLGKKYQIDHLRKEGLRRLKHEFPTKLEDHDKLDPEEYVNFHPSKDMEVEGESAELSRLFAIIKLAHECSIQSILPTLYLLVANFSLDNLLYHSDAPFIPFEAMRSCIYGREKLLEAWMALERDMCPSDNCTSTGCKASLRSLQKTLSQRPDDLSAVVLKWTSFIKTWSDVEDLFEEEICKDCAYEVQKAHDNVDRKAIWKILPGLFKLPAWEDLKDLEG